MIVGHIGGHIGGAGSPYEIQKSLRFRASASAYLSRTSTSGTQADQRKHTYSKWVKRGVLGTAQVLFQSGPDGNNYTSLSIKTDNTIELFSVLGGAVRIYNTWSMVFRDPSAHFHLHLKVDTTQAVASNRVVLTINGVEYPATNQPAQDQYIPMMYWTNPWNARIGAGSYSVSNLFDGYLSEINFIDGQALDASYFGEFSAETGAWIPKKYTGTYGTNGFYLPFTDGSNLTNLTADRSGNGNNWTANNISLTSGVTYDWMDDTPTNNFAVLNSLKSNLPAPPSEANLYAYGTTSAHQVVSTVAFDIGGAGVYAEVVCAASPQASYGIKPADESITTTSGIRGYYQDGTKYIGTGSWLSYGASFTSGNVIGIKAGNGELEFFKNGVSQGVAFSGLSGLYTFVFYNAGSATSGGYWNFGQRPFAYTPPTGFKALCTKNLPTPVIVNPKKHFDIVLATGANIKSTAEAVFPGNFLEWIKDRGNANNHQLIDTVRGTSAVLQSNTTGAETTYSAPSGSSVGWLWKAGGAPVTNNAGSIQSQVSVNPQAGFSIVTYTGNSSTAQTIGHGLGSVPKMIIVKRRDAASDWPVWHTGLTPTTGTLYLDLTSAQTAYPNRFDSTGMTSVVFKTGSQAVPNEVNDSGGTFVAYCFAEVPGFSKIGSYTGNGSSDGPFVYCGFKPRFVMIKLISNAGVNWIIWDTARSQNNLSDLLLFPNLSSAEVTAGGANSIDIVSNGFKVRNAGNSTNESGGTYIFYAVAESPFNYSTAR